MRLTNNYSVDLVKITYFVQQNFLIMKWLRYILLLPLFLINTATATSQDTDFMMDERDGNIYLIMKFGQHWWMCQNLKFDVGEGSSCYEDDETNCMLKGRWYTFEAAKKACPEGFRLPGDEEWMALESYMGMDKAELQKKYIRNSGKIGKYLKVDGGVGFDAEFAGLVNPQARDAYFETHAYFWTSTALDEKNGWTRVFEQGLDGINRKMIPKEYGLSVRCIKDADADIDKE